MCPTSAQRLQQTLSHIQPPTAAVQMSIIEGPTEPKLLDLTLGQLLSQQAEQYGDKECLCFPWTGARLTYTNLNDESMRVARGLLALGIQKGDRIGILAGNCEQYVSVFFAAARIGVVLVVLNSTYTPSEIYYALNHTATECRVLFMTPYIGQNALHKVLNKLRHESELGAILEDIIILRGSYKDFSTYDKVIQLGLSQPTYILQDREVGLSPDEVCNMQFTSGSTGNPKAAMLTHHNLVNNSRFIGDRMKLSSVDIICCPPPLFHCFGLVLGMLAAVSHGAKIIFPSEIFDPRVVLRAISDEKCTALHGVPTMFEAILSLPRPSNFDSSNLRTGIIAGAPVSQTLMKRLLEELNMREFTSSYGLTEASPTCFNAFTTDSIHARLTTVGKVLPHARAKVIDAQGHIVPVGQRGELCIAGYQLTKGYWQNPKATAETLVTDRDGVTWLKTGDEASLDQDGYCGENIYPLEIEERLASHPKIELASVVGIPDRKYGEVVGAFVAVLPNSRPRPSDEELRSWTREKLSRHKAPQYIFVFGEDGIQSTIPMTGSGKIRKVELREMAVAALTVK
ncbi:hypothetical protein NUU61_000679 [Penicillium alfredii]|uniref:Uncharacterized protein n=1 Tax=Penicillium alfredii TaxID=1506179 RepID=A0A9W9GBD5_9EURO|nr:uncharacterized protein NUU61_000679 [Penicillium alfredii]KAJ5114920.1 hypothetical protein NUU61_000679 [Penicillium alfredii]